MKTLKFQSNWPDDNHCMQACVKMVLDSLFKKTSWDKVNEMTHYQDSLYSWTPAGAVAINERISGVRMISTLDYQSFADRGEDYLKELWREDQKWFERQKKMATLGFKRERKDAQYLLSHNIFEHREITKEEIERLLKDGYLIIAIVNADLLAGREGSSGHFVLLYKQEGDDFIIHDPGLPPQEAWRMKKDKFMSAFRREAILIPKLGTCNNEVAH